MQEERTEYTLTSGQMGVSMYNIPLELSLAKNSGIDIEKLTGAIRTAISNHAALMSRLEVRDGLPCFVPYKNSVDIQLIRSADTMQAR